MHGDAIGVNDFLESEGEIVTFDECWRFNGMVFKPFDSCSWVGTKFLPQIILPHCRAPEIANVGCATLSHKVNA
jgi:hypothetical protein